MNPTSCLDLDFIFFFLLLIELCWYEFMMKLFSILEPQSSEEANKGECETKQFSAGDQIRNTFIARRKYPTMIGQLILSCWTRICYRLET